MLTTIAFVFSLNAARRTSGSNRQFGGSSGTYRGVALGEDRVGAVVLVPRLEDDDLVAGIDEREEHGGHRFGRAARDGDLAVRIDGHVVPSPVLLGDAEPERRRAPRDRVLVDVPVNRGACGFLHRLGHREVGEALSEVDRAVLLSDARHLADDGFGEAGGSDGRHAGKLSKRSRRRLALDAIRRPDYSASPWIWLETSRVHHTRLAVAVVDVRVRIAADRPCRRSVHLRVARLSAGAVGRSLASRRAVARSRSRTSIG